MILSLSMVTVVEAWSGSDTPPVQPSNRQPLSGMAVISTTAPAINCLESYNPRGNNIPGEKRSTNNGKTKGVNPDGFYELVSTDICDPEPQIWITYEGYVDPDGNPGVFGPFLSGTIIKFTEALGKTTPTCKRIGSPPQGGATAVTWHITLPSEPIVIAVDFSGNANSCGDCLVPPPPK